MLFGLNALPSLLCDSKEIKGITVLSKNKASLQDGTPTFCAKPIGRNVHLSDTPLVLNCTRF